MSGKHSHTCERQTACVDVSVQTREPSAESARRPGKEAKVQKLRTGVRRGNGTAVMFSRRAELLWLISITFGRRHWLLIFAATLTLEPVDYKKQRFTQLNSNRHIATCFRRRRSTFSRNRLGWLQTAWWKAQSGSLIGWSAIAHGKCIGVST